MHADCGAELGFPAARLSFSCMQQAGPVAQRGPHTEPTQHSTPPRLRNAQHQAQGVKQPSTTSRTGSEGHGDSHAARAPNHAHQHLFALHCSAPISHPRCIYTATPPSVCITQDHPDARILLAPPDNTHPFSMPVSLVLWSALIFHTTPPVYDRAPGRHMGAKGLNHTQQLSLTQLRPSGAAVKTEVSIRKYPMSHEQRLLTAPLNSAAPGAPRQGNHGLSSPRSGGRSHTVSCVL